MLPVNKFMAIVEGTGGREVNLYASPQWVRITPTGKLTPVADVVTVTHNNTTKSFRAEMADGKFVECVPVNKVPFSNAEIINEKGHFGHIVDNPPDEIQFDITHSPSVVKDDNGWWTEIDGVKFGMGIGDWKRTFGKSMSIAGNRITLDVSAVRDKAVVDGKLDLDPTTTIDAATSYEGEGASPWATVRDLANSTAEAINELDVRAGRSGGTRTIIRSAMDFDTSGVGDFEKAHLVLDRDAITGAALVRAFNSTGVVADDASSLAYAVLKTKHGGTLSSPTINSTEYDFDITSIAESNAAFSIGLAELHDVDDDEPADGENFVIEFDPATARIRFTLKAAWKDGWGFRERIEIPTSVTDSDLTNFPAYVPINSADIAARAQADGDDIIYTTDDGTTALKVDRESYSAGVGHDHVKIPLVNSDGANTVFYRYYGNPDATDTLDPTNVWDANYLGVWHLSGDLVNTITTVGATDNSTVGYATGKILQGRENDAGADHRLETDITPVGDTHTISGWVKYDVDNIAQSLLGVHDNNQHRLYISASAAGKLVMGFGDSNKTTDTDYPTGTFCHVAMTGDGTTARLYLNGSEVDTLAYSQAGDNASALKLLARNFGAAITEPLDGVGDDLRYSNTNRSADWIAAQYVNQSDPDTFFNVGTSRPEPLGMTMTGTTTSLRRRRR